MAYLRNTGPDDIEVPSLLVGVIPAGMAVEIPDVDDRTFPESVKVTKTKPSGVELAGDDEPVEAVAAPQ